MNGNPSGAEGARLDGLTAEDWRDLQFAYNFGLLDPEPGSVEAAAFAEMDAYSRAEVARVAGEDEADRAYSAALADRRAS
jgi:hypothetical protein